jgi:hypothetical protein
MAIGAGLDAYAISDISDEPEKKKCGAERVPNPI